MYKVILERGYMQIALNFQSVIDAAGFMQAVLTKAEQEVKVTIELVKKETEGIEKNE